MKLAEFRLSEEELHDWAVHVVQLRSQFAQKA